MPKETCPVCGIQITYKNLARHIKLRHKIKYKFCHKCRKFVPNDTYDDHRVTCNLEAGPIGDQVKKKNNSKKVIQTSSCNAGSTITLKAIINVFKLYHKSQSQLHVF